MDAKLIIYLVMLTICFNPRARDGREKVGSIVSGDVEVSIHAPVMDANGAVDWRYRPTKFQSTRP